MQTKLFTQPKLFNGKNYSLGSNLEQLFMSRRPKYTEACLFFGLVKENAYDKIYSNLKAFIINGGNIKFYLSSEKKGATRKVVNSLLDLGCEVYIFTGNDKDFITDFQYKGAIFSSSQKATVLLSTGNFSLSGLYDGHNIVTQFNFNLSTENEEFSNTTTTLFPEYTMKLFNRVTRENFEEVLKTPEKILPSIEEFTRKDVENSAPINTSTDDLSIDIEIDDNVDFLVAPEPTEKPKKEKVVEPKVETSKMPEPIEAIEFGEPKYYLGDNVADALDIENMLYENSSNSLKSVFTEDTKIVTVIDDEPEEEEYSDYDEVDSKVIAKSANLPKTSIFMLQLPKLSRIGEIKIPTYVRDLIPEFWGWPSEYLVSKDSAEKLRTCKFEIIDTKDPETTITDDSAKLFQREGESNFIILSDKLVAMDLLENDIVRFIKTQSQDGTYYTCEVVRTDAKEYPIWEQFCTNTLKGSKRKYGLM